MFCTFTFDRGLRFWSGLLVFQVHCGCWGFHTGLLFHTNIWEGNWTCHQNIVSIPFLWVFTTNCLLVRIFFGLFLKKRFIGGGWTFPSFWLKDSMGKAHWWIFPQILNCVNLFMLFKVRNNKRAKPCCKGSSDIDRMSYVKCAATESNVAPADTATSSQHDNIQSVSSEGSVARIASPVSMHQSVCSFSTSSSIDLFPVYLPPSTSAYRPSYLHTTTYLSPIRASNPLGKLLIFEPIDQSLEFLPTYLRLAFRTLVMFAQLCKWHFRPLRPFNIAMWRRSTIHFPRQTMFLHHPLETAIEIDSASHAQNIIWS